MFIEIERYVDFIVKHSLSQRQMLFLYLIYLKRFDLMKKYLTAYPCEDGKFLSKIELEDLLSKGFVIKVDSNGNVNDYLLGNTFKSIFIDKHIATDELLNLYPPYMIDNGKKMPLTMWDKYELMNTYAQRIGHSVEEHEEILKDLQYAIDNNLIRYKIESFVRSEQWTHIRKLRLNTNVTILEDELS